MLAIYCRTSKESNASGGNDSTIEQQEQKGVSFALSNKFQFKVYKDEGKSGFKMDDETNPFSHRPAFTTLVNDIKAGQITKLWVWEHSRLSRNQYASAFIFNILEKHNVTLYENDKELSLKDPQYQFMRQILDAVSQYERNLIVNRTTRGLYNAINNGKRAYYKFYGYKRVGRDDARHTVWKPVKSEMEKIKFAYKTILNGGSLRSLIGHLYSTKTVESRSKEMLSLLTKWTRILSHFEYTGYCLNTEGIDILHKYQNFEIDSISVLKDSKYLVKSVPYPAELISVEDWITCAEKQHLNKVARNNSLDKSSRRASKDLCTGLVRCGYCNSRYYSYLTKYRDKPYPYYKHITSITKNDCPQRPKTFAILKIDEIYKIFYFYFYLVFDDTKRVIEESMREIGIKQLETKEHIASVEKQLVQSQRQIKKFTAALDGADDVKIIQVLAGRIMHTEEKISNDANLLASLKIELEVLTDKYSGTELQNVYYSVKDRIINFFEKMNIEQQRNELLRVVKKSIVFGDCLAIEASSKLFLFDISYHKMYKFDSESYNKLMKDEVYLDNFLNLDTVQRLEATQYDDKPLADWDLEKKFKKEKMRIIIGDYFKELGVHFDLTSIDHVVSFLDMEKFMAFMLMRTAKNIA
jgi:DNA invertase Pin-like site-specific DNA recombinase